MRNVKLLAILMAVLLTGSLEASSDETVVKLLDLLIEKGILSEQEAAGLMEETKEAVSGTEQETPKDKVAEKPILPEPSQPPLDSRFLSVREKIDFGGDLRLRYDSQRRELEDASWDRRRPRFRLRFGMIATPTENTEVGFRLASGSGFQNTTNQSFGEHGRGKNIFIDRAYGSWEPTRWFKIIGGKHENPFFSSSLVWDSDVNLEGASQRLTFKGENVQLFSNLTQFVISELDLKSVSNNDPIMLGYQGGLITKPAKNTELQLGVTYYDYRSLDLLSSEGIGDRTTFVGYNNSHGQQMVFDANNRLLNKFGTIDLGAELRLNMTPWPLGFFGNYIKNLRSDIQLLQREGVPTEGSDPADLAAYGSDNRDTGYQFGLGYGFRGKKGDLHLQYLYQVLEDYAFPAVFVDSDFHGGGTNNRGHRARDNYFLTDNIYFQGVFFFTKRDNIAKDGKQDEDRAQLDLIFRF